MIANGRTARRILPGALQPGETLRVVQGVPHIVYHRSAGRDCPLAVFLPGGGHLARVAYGHPGSDPRDFLDHWLHNVDFGLLALSYPSDHAAFSTPLPEVTIPQWTASVAALIREYVQEYPCREIIALGWSMAGRSAVALERALRGQGLSLSLFVSLAATAPLPGLLPTALADERFTPEGFWDSSTRHPQWLRQVAEQLGASGLCAIEPQEYLDHYVINSPFPLRGQPRDIHAGVEAQLADEGGAFAYADYPALATIVPENSADRLHALTDGALWGALNVLRMAHRIGRDRNIDASRWQSLRTLLAGAPRRLSRFVPGAHFFFLGEAGAKATVRHIMDLVREASAVEAELRTLLDGADARDQPASTEGMSSWHRS